jgi:hypothetical protein
MTPAEAIQRSLRKAEIDRDAHPRIEIPTFHAEPRLREEKL